KDNSEAEYPVNAFGSFHTKEGRTFLEDEYIPHLAKKLDQAVQTADSHKILVYVRALGNCGHRKILKIFKPYLEGDKQCSQFQRLQMVVALDHLAENKPAVARSVSYKIYQNAAETKEVRVAAVYQLMRTDPPASMIQSMAEYTNYDTDEHVNAAVKSWIESAAELEGDEYADLASKCKAALPLLTEDDYGFQQSHAHIRSKVRDEVNLQYLNELEIIGSDDSYIPQGLLYSFSKSLNGANRDIVLAEALVSSIDELTNVISQQLEQTKKNEQQKADATANENKPFSSSNVIKKLNMQFDEREQLEGAIRVSLGEAERYFTFNNRSLENLPQDVQDWENELRAGKKISYTKLVSKHEATIAFPTIMGLPVIFKSEYPSLIRVEGEVKAQAKPQISNGKSLRAPRSARAQGYVRAVLAGKIQSSISFITPHDHQQYSAGYDRNAQAYIPVRFDVDVDVENQKLAAQIEPLEAKGTVDIFHYSAQPYVAQEDILDLKPSSKSNDYQPIRDDQLEQIKTSFGKHSTGMSFGFEYESDEPIHARRWLHEQLHSDDPISSLLASINDDDELAYTSMNISYQGERSIAYKVLLRLNYKSEEHDEQPAPDKSINWNQIPQKHDERVKYFLEAVASQIRSASASAGEADVKFQGDHNYHYTATYGYANSPVDERSRFLAQVNRKFSNANAKPFKVTVDSSGKTPNTNGLDYVYAKNFDPTSTNEIYVTVGENYDNSAKFAVKAKLSQSQERQQYVDQTFEAQQCKSDMQQGNTQLPECANATAEANLLDQISAEIKYRQIGKETRENVQNAYQFLSHMFYEFIEENNVNMSGMEENGKLKVDIEFENDLSSVNVSVQAKETDIQAVEIPLSELEQALYVVHPVFSASERAWGELNNEQVYLPFCTVDANAVSTFDNRTYPAELVPSWTVAFHYVPDYAQHKNIDPEQQREQMQVEEHLVLVRGQRRRQLKITARSPDTQGKLVEIDLLTNKSGRVEAQVDGQEQQFDQNQAAHVENNYILIYELPNNEVKVEIGDDYYVIFDGERAKITVTDDKFNNALRGLCGTFDGDETTDLTGPQNCVLSDPQEFVEHYTLDFINPNGRCVKKEQHYVSVISQRDIGESSNNRHAAKSKKSSGSCTKHQTQYTEQGNQICFSLRPLPVCKSSCKAENVIAKDVQVHCIEKNNVAQLWTKQIDKGASPDFSLKPAHKYIQFKVPQKCH
ncbi:hypothetical protein AMK59_5996, partial [Oryctes borbonicus]